MAKTTTNSMNRVPPFMPIVWQEWEADSDTSTMTDLQVGIFFKMLLRQWVVGSVPANVSDIIRECKLDSGRNTVLRFLEAYPHLWTCDACGADFVRTECGCSTDAVRTLGEQSTDAQRTRGVRGSYRRRTNPRLKNLRIDVNSGLELGTTKQNQTKPEPEQKPTASCKSQPKPMLQSDDPAPQGVQASRVQPEQEDRPVLVHVEPAVRAPQVAAEPRQELGNIRDWSEDRFGIPGARLRNCILFHLDYSKNDWYRQNPPTLASMERERFVAKLDKDTPVGWSPETQNQKPEQKLDTSAQQAALDLARAFGAQIS